VNTSVVRKARLLLQVSNERRRLKND